MKRLSLALTCALAVISLATAARADIFQWAWVNPNDPSQGKYQSTTLCPGGSGLNAVPNAYFGNRNLTQAYLIGANLTNSESIFATLNYADLSGADLTNAYMGYDTLANANLNGTNLTNADFAYVTLTGANMTNADVSGANFRSVTGLTAAQLYSTANYNAGNLTGITLASDDLTSWNFAGQNLTSANLLETQLAGADLTGAVLCGADLTNAVLSSATLDGANLSGSAGFTSAQLYSTESYYEHNLRGIVLSGIDLTSWNLAGQGLENAGLIGAVLTNANLSGANLNGATLAGANLTNATVSGANLSCTGITAAQMYSTATYQAGDLTGIGLGSNDLTGWNFAGQTLTNAYLASATLTGANFNGVNMTGADVRGATGLNLTGAASTQNLINVDGSINGLDLSGGRTLVVRNYTAASIPIKVHTGMNMGTNGTIQVVLDGNAWGSTISFDPGIPVTLGGTLDVTLAPGVTPGSMWKVPVKLFDWTGVTPTGMFTWQNDPGIGSVSNASHNSMLPEWEFPGGGGGGGPTPDYLWDITHLYDTGTITLFVGGDVNDDGALNSLDIDAIYQHLTVAPPGYVNWPRPLLTWSSALAQYDVAGLGAVTQDDVTYELNHYFHTSYGDANLDRSTDFVDFQTLLNHWQNSGPGIGWAQADFNGDGVVDFMDFQMLLNYWNPMGWNFAPSEAPEPASLSLILLGGLALLRRSRK
jgi:uncharacterized protein YjbI with pentapeptide repeats